MVSVVGRRGKSGDDQVLVPAWRESCGLVEKGIAMKKEYLPLIALVVGFIWAFITASIHNMLFALLPLLAFAFGYFSSWQRGLLNGFLLFFGYTMATAIMWRGVLNTINLLTYFYTFTSGGFSLLVIGAIAPIVRRGIRRPASIAVLAISMAMVVWCGSQAWPAYSSYYYQVIIHTSEDVDSLELYLPVGAVSGTTYEALYDSPLRVPGRLTEDYTLELIDTEQGHMLKLTINELMNEGPQGYPHTGNIIFREENPPQKLIHLMPRYDVVPLDRVESQHYVGLTKVSESRIIEEFKVPIMVKSGTDADFELRLENRTGRGGWINFTYGKSNTYTELIRYEGSTSDEWLLIPVEVTDRMSISGVGD